MALNGMDLAVSWGGRPQTLGEFVDQAIAFVRRLQPVHPLFAGPLWLTGTSPREIEQVASDLANIESFTRKYGWDRGAPKDWHTGVEAGRTMSRAGTSATGFSISLSSGRGTSKAHTLEISLHGGEDKPEYGGSVRICFPEEGADEFKQAGFVRQLMLMAIEHWQPQVGDVAGYKFLDAQEPPNIDELRRARVPNIEEVRWVRVPQPRVVGWMSYFSKAGVCAAMPPDVQCEPFGPYGGALMTLQQAPALATDPNAVAAAIRVRNALEPGRWLYRDV
jgi:hypothetical protein